MFETLQSTNGSFGDLSTRWRLTWGRLPSVSGGLNQVFSFHPSRWLELLRICCGPMRRGVWVDPSHTGVAGGTSWRQMDASGSCPSRYLSFRRRLIRWLTADAVHSDCGRKGTSPVKLTNHFPQVRPPTTLTLDRQLTVSAADRRTVECWSAVLHHFAEAGTSSRPNRDSSRGLVSWLLRYHCLR